jgi:uncharacterized protein
MSKGIEAVEAFLNSSPDVEAMIKHVHEDAVFHEADCLAWGGEFRGHEGFLELLGKMAESFDTEVRDLQIMDAGDVITTKFIVNWKSKKTGESVDMPIVEIFTVKDGLIVDDDIFYKDAALVASFT